VHLTLDAVAEGLTAPVSGTTPIGHTDHLWVVDQAGELWSIDVETGARALVADLSDRLVALGAFGPGSFDERGFLGLACHPDYVDNGLIYTYTSEPVDGEADFSTMPAGVTPTTSRSSRSGRWRTRRIR
jgi:hypothetical protein